MQTSSSPSPSRPTGAPAASHRKYGLIFAVVGLLVAGLVVYVVVRGPSASTRVRPVRATPVSATAARSGDLHIYLTALGSVTAWNTVTVRSRADGQLLKLHFTEGQHVQEGDLLAEIDPRAYQVGLEQAQGQLARDQALLDNANRDLERYRSAGEAVTPQQTDTAKATADQYEGIVRIDQGNVDNFKLQLSYCRILAPAAGRVGIRLVDEGNLVHASDSTGIVVITQDQPIAVLFSLPEDNLPQVRRALRSGQPLAVEAFNRAMNQVLATGNVIAMDNQIDPTTGTVRLKSQFTNDDGALFPNQFVNVRLMVEVVPNSILIPVAAAQISGNKRFVFVLKADSTVEQRTVTLGRTEGDTIAVTEGLAAGDVVVTEGLDKLQDGSQVVARTVPAAGAAGTAAPAAGEHKKGNWNGKRQGKKDDAKTP